MFSSLCLLDDDDSVLMLIDVEVSVFLVVEKFVKLKLFRSRRKE